MTQPAINNRDTYIQPRFGVEINGIVDAVFDEVSGLDAKMEPFEIKEGGLNGYTHKFPARVSHSNITLKWGSAHSTDMYDWYARVVSKADRTAEMRDISILQLDQSRQEVRRWNLTRAFPVNWKGPAFNAANSQIAVESVEIAFSNMTLVKR